MSSSQISIEIKKNHIFTLHPISERRIPYKKFFNAQLENSTKTDWTFQVQKDLEELDITINFEDIKNMSKNMFKNYIKKKVEIGALIYLKSQIKSKGKKLEYSKIKIQKHLRPDSKLNIAEKQELFKMRTRTIDIKEKMKQKHDNPYCVTCNLKGIKKKETQKHVYKCTQLNSKLRKIKHKEICGSKISEIKYIIKRMNTNLMKRKLLTKT